MARQLGDCTVARRAKRCHVLNLLRYRRTIAIFTALGLFTHLSFTPHALQDSTMVSAIASLCRVHPRAPAAPTVSHSYGCSPTRACVATGMTTNRRV